MARGTVAKKIRGLGTDGNFLTNKICYIILFEKIIIKLIQTHRPPSICKPYSPIILTFNGFNVAEIIHIQTKELPVHDTLKKKDILCDRSWNCVGINYYSKYLL